MTTNDEEQRRSSFTEKLDGWARQHFCIDTNFTDLVWLTLGGNLDFRFGKVCELYLRLWSDATFDEIGYWPGDTLVIARIAFQDRRAGHGRALLEFFIRQAELYGYDKIALEHTHDGDDIQGFAKKYGFQHAPPTHPLPNRNWIASISRIAGHLNQTAPSP